jgi:hypothetical protein
MDTKKGDLFIGRKLPWYDIFDSIEHVGWVGWDVDGVKEYGTIGNWIVYGTTADGRWFVIDMGEGIPPRFFTDRQVWVEKLVELGAPSDPPLIGMQEGSTANYSAMWASRLLTFGLVVIVISFPWILILYVQRHRWRKRLAISESKNTYPIPSDCKG